MYDEVSYDKKKHIPYQKRELLLYIYIYIFFEVSDHLDSPG